MNARRRDVLRLLALSPWAAPQALAVRLDQSLPPGGFDLSLGVFLNDDRVGEHRVRVRKPGRLVEIEHNLDITVKLAFITAYALQHRSVEQWEGDDPKAVRLVALSAATTEDGVAIEVAGKREGAAFVVRGARGQYKAPLDVATTNSFWVDVAVLRTHLIDSMDGGLIEARVKNSGTEVVDGKSVQHVDLIAGEHSAQAWFADSVLWRGSFARHGHRIVYRAR